MKRRAIKKATLVDSVYRLTWAPHTSTRFAIKGLVWNKGIKSYECPATSANQRVLQLLGFAEFSEVPAPVNSKPPAVEVPVMPTRMRLPNAGVLRQYQREGVFGIERFRGRAWLADEMGLGKTLQALTWVAAHERAFPSLVVCPSCAKCNWEAEVLKWLPGRTATVLSGRRALVEKMTDFYIINYDILSDWVDVLTSLRFGSVVIDEAHYIKQHRLSGGRGGTQKVKVVKRTDAVLKVCRKVPFVIAMTGTPMKNRVMDMFVVLHLLRPDVFKSRFDFGMRFCESNLDRWSGRLEFSGCIAPKELYQLLTTTVMIRRRKCDVLKELPPKVRVMVRLPMEKTAAYIAVERQAAEDSSPGSALVRVGALRRETAIGKLSLFIEWLEGLVASQQKTIVFIHHREVGDALAKAFPSNSVSYRGGMSQEMRKKVEFQFQNDPACILFLASITACGVAINLTAASNVVVYELPWTPSDLAQAEDRAHRIGQQSTVTVYHIIAPDTIDEDMFRVVVEKAGLSKEVVDGVSDASSSAKAVVDLMLRRLRKKS